MALTDKEKIDAAINAHGQWISRLRAAINTGTSDFRPATVRLDNACEFGKWLYGDFPRHARRSPIWGEIQALHAAFHEQAAVILQLAMSGKQADALMAMAPDRDFTLTSGRLLIKLRALAGVL